MDFLESSSSAIFLISCLDPHFVSSCPILIIFLQYITFPRYVTHIITFYMWVCVCVYYMYMYMCIYIITPIGLCWNPILALYLKVSWHKLWECLLWKCLLWGLKIHRYENDLHISVSDCKQRHLISASLKWESQSVFCPLQELLRLSSDINTEKSFSITL